MGIFLSEIKISAWKKYEINLDFAACLLDITTHTLYANESFIMNYWHRLTLMCSVNEACIIRL
mgnify:CR=1 FL=1